jgi:hypothetical protein
MNMEILCFKNVGYISPFLKKARNSGPFGESLRLHLPCSSAFLAVTGGIVTIPYL